LRLVVIVGFLLAPFKCLLGAKVSGQKAFALQAPLLIKVPSAGQGALVGV